MQHSLLPSTPSPSQVLYLSLGAYFTAIRKHHSCLLAGFSGDFCMLYACHFHKLVRTFIKHIWFVCWSVALSLTASNLCWFNSCKLLHVILLWPSLWWYEDRSKILSSHYQLPIIYYCYPWPIIYYCK